MAEKIRRADEDEWSEESENRERGVAESEDEYDEDELDEEESDDEHTEDARSAEQG